VLPPLCGPGFLFFEVSAVPRRILVVDDDAAQRRSLSLGLRVCGFASVEASSGEEALSFLQADHVDLVITDLMMPGIGGLHFVRRLQTAFPQLPVVLMSGYHLGRRHIERAGLRVLAFVPKPYDIGELASFLHAKLATSAAS
jgi:CheY-like chemotaxis protein